MAAHLKLSAILTGLAALCAGPVMAETLAYSGTNIGYDCSSGFFCTTNIATGISASGPDIARDLATGDPVLVGESTITVRYTGLVIGDGSPTSLTWTPWVGGGSSSLPAVTMPAGDGEFTLTLPAGRSESGLSWLVPHDGQSNTFGTFDIYVTKTDTTGPVLQSIDLDTSGGLCKEMILTFDEPFYAYGGSTNQMFVSVDGVQHSTDAEPFGGNLYQVRIPVFTSLGVELEVHYVPGAFPYIGDEALNEPQEFQITGRCDWGSTSLYDGSGPLMPVTDTGDSETSADTTDDTDAETDATGSDANTGTGDVADANGDSGDTGSTDQTDAPSQIADTAANMIGRDMSSQLQINLATRRTLVSGARTRMERSDALAVSQNSILDMVATLRGLDEEVTGNGRLRFQDRIADLDIYVQGDMRFASGGGRASGAGTVLAIIERSHSGDSLVGLNFGLGITRGQSTDASPMSTKTTNLSAGIHGVKRTAPGTVFDGFAVIGRQIIEVSLTDAGTEYDGKAQVWSVGAGGSLSHDGRLGQMDLRHVASVDFGQSFHPDVALTAASGATVEIPTDRVRILTLRYAPEIKIGTDRNLPEIDLSPSINCQINKNGAGSSSSCGAGAGIRITSGTPDGIRITATAGYERLNGTRIGSVGLNLEHRF